MFRTVRTLETRVARLLTAPVAPSATKPVTRTRLGIDVFLEVRDCPANMYWTGEYGTSFTGRPGPPGPGL